MSVFLFVMLLMLGACGDQNEALIEESRPETQEVIQNADARDSSTFFTLTIQSRQSEPKICSTFTPKVNLLDLPLLFRSDVRLSRLNIKTPFSQEEQSITFDANSVPTFSFYAYEVYALCAEHDGSPDEDESIFVQISEPSGDDEYLGASESEVAKLINSKNCTKCDFTNFDFNGFRDLSGVNLSGSNLTNAKQLPKNLSGSNFDGVNFTGVTMSGVNLSHSSFNAAIFTREHFRPLSVDGASFVNVDFGYGANFRDLENKAMRGVNFSGAKLQGASFQNLTIENSTFDRADLSNASFNSVNWVGHSGFFGTTLEGVNFNMSSTTPIYFAKPTQSECIGGGGSWDGMSSECSAYPHQGLQICANRGGIALREAWFDLLSSCGAKTNKSSWNFQQGRVAGLRKCMSDKGFVVDSEYTVSINPGSVFGYEMIFTKSDYWMIYNKRWQYGRIRCEK